MSYSNIEQIIHFFSSVSSKIEEFPMLHSEIEEQFLDYQTMSENDHVESSRNWRWEIVWYGCHMEIFASQVTSSLRECFICFGCFPQKKEWLERIKPIFNHGCSWMVH